ncbi:hypothetical protein KEM55_006045 [Ascosphaera atra]|nr:hypothetical protein KEM55_006045 [Ascosphaera atra]
MTSRPPGSGIPSATGHHHPISRILNAVPAPPSCVSHYFPLLDNCPRLRTCHDWKRWYLHICAATQCVFLRWDSPLTLPDPSTQTQVLDAEYRVLYSAFWQKVLSTVDEVFLGMAMQYKTLSAQVNFLKWFCEQESQISIEDYLPNISIE